MRLLVPPGVFRPISDTWLLARCLERELRPGASVADVCTGSGALAIAAGRAGAGEVVAIDRSRRAVAAAWLNGRLNGVPLRARRGDLLDAVPGQRFDAIVSNPPYVPAWDDGLPDHGPARHVDAGRDGRALLDRLCAQAPEHLRPGGALLVVHSSICGEQATLSALAEAGLRPDVVARERGRLGPLMRARAPELRKRGLLAPDADEEELLVVRGRRPALRPARRPGTREGTPRTAAGAPPRRGGSR